MSKIWDKPCVGSTEHMSSLETCFLVFCCLYVGIPGHSSDPLVEFVASDTCFVEGNRWKETSLWCTVFLCFDNGIPQAQWSWYHRDLLQHEILSYICGGTLLKSTAQPESMPPTHCAEFPFGLHCTACTSNDGQIKYKVEVQNRNPMAVIANIST